MAQATRRPTIAAVENAARVLSQAVMAEAGRIRAEQGHNGHVAAQELEHLAIDISGVASRIKAMRDGH